MKKKRIVIISFVLVAVLAMGIGFAAMADTLTISGPVSFVVADEVLGQKAAAIKFESAKALTVDNPNEASPVTVLANKSATDENLANISVTINGVTGRVTPYVGEALFTVIYESTNTTLDPVYLFPKASISNNPDGFTVETFITDEEGNVLSGENTNKLALGGTMYVKVVVKYDPNGVATERTLVENITVQLVYEDVNVNPTTTP